MESEQNLQQVDALVGRIFLIEDITLGGQKDPYWIRYRGRLRSEDSAAAYDQLAALLAPLNLTPLFRWDGDRHAVLVTASAPPPKNSNIRINVLMFVLSLLSVLLVGGLYGTQGEPPADAWGLITMLLVNGWPFAVSMFAILGAHEFGHYLVGRHHGVHVTLPYFIPFPFGAFGTMGAFINMKGTPKNRNHLLDIGVAGPLAGLVVAVPVLLIGLSMSSIQPLPAVVSADAPLQLEGNSLLYLLAKYLVFGQLLPAPQTYHGVAPFLYWVGYFISGRPLPLGGADVMLGPVAWAGWGGLLVTALNLIPAGQLDGGHVINVLFGRQRAERLRPVILVVLAGLGIFWSGWWLWAALIFFLGRYYAEPLDQITPLDGRRRFLAILTLVVFILTFIPVPLQLMV